MGDIESREVAPSRRGDAMSASLANLEGMADRAVRDFFPFLSQRRNDGSETLYVAATGAIIRSAKAPGVTLWPEARNAVMTACLTPASTSSREALRAALLSSAPAVTQ